MAHADRMEIIERDIEIYRYDFQPVQANTRAVIGDIPDAAGVHTDLASEKDQRIPADQRSTARAPFHRSSLKHFLKGWHFKTDDKPENGADTLSLYAATKVAR
jgi:hypothetical protein